MIKRMKWNVLYGGGDGVESDGGLSSSSASADDLDEKDITARQSEANQILQQLVEEDPYMAETLQAKLEALKSSSEEEDEDENEGPEIDAPKDDGERINLSKDGCYKDSDDSDDDSTPERQVKSQHEANDMKGEYGEEDTANITVKEEDSEDQKYSEHRECKLCRGKRLLSDQQVESHLSSKKHLRAVARLEEQLASEKLEKRESDQKSTCVNGGLGKLEAAQAKQKNVGKDRVAVDEISLEQKQAEKRRKAKVKRKLKALKRRRWDKVVAKNISRAGDREKLVGDVETEVDKSGIQNAQSAEGDGALTNKELPVLTVAEKKRSQKRKRTSEKLKGEEEVGGRPGKTDDGEIKKTSLELTMAEKEGASVVFAATISGDINKSHKRNTDNNGSSLAQVVKKKKRGGITTELNRP